MDEAIEFSYRASRSGSVVASSPNVLIVLNTPRRVRLAFGIHRDVTRIGLRLDDGAAFLAALSARCAMTSPSA